jgi:NAD(P)-dependent dehydrogenase (short-subunit alcohol dehydrogenase family)
LSASNGLLEGKIVVVSGVGPGLGRSIAVECARAGADIVLAARTEDRLKSVAAEVEALGRRALPVETDVTEEASCERLARAALDAFGRVDTLVNNAFLSPPLTDLADADFEKVRAAFEVNVFAALRLTNLFAAALIESRGSVVMINSSVLRHSQRPYGAYKMTKASLLALAQNLSTELGPKGVRVNTVAPGYIWADTLKSYFEYLGRKRGVDAQVVYDEIAATIDLRKLPEPGEIAGAVVFLASDLARAISGHCLDVNGGQFHH